MTENKILFPNASIVEANSDSTEDSVAHSSDCAMKTWFRCSSQRQCEAMTAIQLDYQFEADDFRIEWWAHAEELGFTRIDHYHYRLPQSLSEYYLGEDSSEAGVIHTAQSLCRNLNAIGIPQGKSCFDRIGDETSRCRYSEMGSEWNYQRARNVNGTKYRILNQWSKIRDKLVFQKFHASVTETTQNQGKKRIQYNCEDKVGGVSCRKPQLGYRKRKMWSSLDAGAELFFKKDNQKRRLRSAKTSNRDDAPDSHAATVTYPTLGGYKKYAQSHPLQRAATSREDNLVQFVSIDDWNFLLSTNHSLLVSGVGSKKTIMEQIASDKINGEVIQINGCDQSLTTDGILQLLIDEWLDGEQLEFRRLYHGNQTEMLRGDIHPQGQARFSFHGQPYLFQKAIYVAKAIAETVMSTSRPITLVVHNMDSMPLSNHTAQQVLSFLVSHSQTACGLNAIRLIASIDHVNTQILTESLSRHQLNWIQIGIHTQRPYVDEVLSDHAIDIEGNDRKLKVCRTADGINRRLEDSMTDRKYSCMEQESIFSVLKSLSSTHAETLRQLAWLHLESHNEWVCYTDLLNQCRKERIVQADQQLRLYLGELLDHNILERSKMHESLPTPHYRIPFPGEILSSIWEFRWDS